jgi:hypothetical protein
MMFFRYRSEDYEEACRLEREWLDLLLRMQQCRRIYPNGIEAQVLVVIFHDRARHLRN